MVAFERYTLVKATALFVIPDLFGNVFCRICLNKVSVICQRRI